MKYIKKFEIKSYETANLLPKLFEHIKNLLIIHNFDRNIVMPSKTYTGYNFWYRQSSIHTKLLFKIHKIDYYLGDLDMYFEFHLDISLTDNFNDYVPTKLFDIISFIVENIPEEKLIAYSKINDIIKNTSQKKLELYLDAKKYNL